MSKLGNMLRRAGILTDAQLDQVATHLQSCDQSFVDAILQLHLIDENSLVTFIQRKLLILRADDPVLLNVPMEVAKRITGEVAWKFRVLPVSDDGRSNLTLAMADPTDMNAVEAVATQTGGAYIIRAVANPITLLKALSRCYGDYHHTGAQDSNSQSKSPQSSASATKLHAVTIIPDPPINQSLSNNTVNSRKDLRTGLFASPFSTNSFQQAHRKLMAAENRDALTGLLQDFLASGFDRVLLFVHTHGEIRGHDARGTDIAVEQVRRICIPSCEPSTLSKVIDSGSAYFGPFGPGSEIDRAFDRALGGRTDPILAFPVRVAGKSPLVVFAQGLNCSLQIQSVNEFAESVGKALTRILAKRRSALAQLR